MSGNDRRRFQPVRQRPVRPSFGSSRRSFVIYTLDHRTGDLEPLTDSDRRFVEAVRANVRRHVRRRRLRVASEYAAWCAAAVGAALAAQWAGW